MTQPHGRIPAETVEGIEQAYTPDQSLEGAAAGMSRSQAARQALQAERDRVQDSLGHDSTCRRRQPPDGRSRGIDPENCERCRYLQGLLDQASISDDQVRELRAEDTAQAGQRGFVPGETVEVHAMGYWYTGTVKKATPKTVTVTYTSGSGVTRDKTVSNPTRPDMADLDPHNAGQVLVRHPGQVMP